MTIDDLLSRLERTRKAGTGRWSARCPAHADRGPSLSIRELADGRILLHCFAGCDVGQIVAALGLELSDLFPPGVDDATRAPRQRKPFTAREAALALRRELLVVWVLLSDVAAGRPFDARLRARAAVARERCVALLSEICDDD